MPPLLSRYSIGLTPYRFGSQQILHLAIHVLVSQANRHLERFEVEGVFCENRRMVLLGEVMARRALVRQFQSQLRRR